MEKIRILGVDPSLRNTGMGIVTYNTEMLLKDPKAFSVSQCQTLTNPQKCTGTDAILNMLDMINEESKKECYQDNEKGIIESPAIMYDENCSGGTHASIVYIYERADAGLGSD